MLRNPTSYKLAFQLAQAGQSLSSEEVERDAALNKQFGWAQLHSENMAQELHLVVVHFCESVCPLLHGMLKATVVVGSRTEALQWKLATERSISEQGYPLGTLVAFSGEVRDPDFSPVGLSKRSHNPNFKGDIRAAFKGSDDQILLVAYMFQIGSDQPLLCGMGVDRRRGGNGADVLAPAPLPSCKATTDLDDFVVDFVNELNDISAAFKTDDVTAEQAEATTATLSLDRKTMLDAQGHDDADEIDRVVKLLPDESRCDKVLQSQFLAATQPVAQRLMPRDWEDRLAYRQAVDAINGDAHKRPRDGLDAFTLFHSDKGTDGRFSTFLAQIVDSANTGLEKWAMFDDAWLPLLESEREIKSIDRSKVVLT